MKGLPIVLFACVAAFVAWLLYVPGRGFTLHPIEAQQAVPLPPVATAPLAATPGIPTSPAAELPTTTNAAATPALANEASATHPATTNAATVAPPPAPTVPTVAAPAPVTPRQAAELASRIAQAQRSAVAKYPELSVAGSEINSRFVFRYKRLLAQNSARLQDPSWPLQLADECAAASAPQGNARHSAVVAASHQ